MNYEEMFSKLDASIPNDSFSANNNNNVVDTPRDIIQNYEPQYRDQLTPMNWEDTFNGFKTTPVLYNLDGFISPYASNNWGGTSSILQYIDDSSRLPAFENKIDPNKIFSSEINALRALAADQQKITKLFEKKLMESLTERGKVGLTEEDVEAMSALTSARATIASISKEQVNIKKNITDIRIKQSQSSASANSGTGSVDSRGGASTDAIGRSMLDNIFKASASPVTIPQTVVDYQPTSSDMAGRVLDSIVPPIQDIVLNNEKNNPTTYAVVGDTDDDIEFITYSESGEIIPDYPHPDKISRIDRDAGYVQDDSLVQYAIKNKNEL